MKRLAALAVVLLAVACGSTSTARVSPSPSPPSSSTQAASPTPTASPSGSATPSSQPVPHGLLFAALEAKGGGSNPTAWNTIAIAGLDGYARAKTTMKPMPSPYVGCAGPIMPRQAYALPGSVVFADGDGVIRSLSVTNHVTQLTRFPITSTQQILSFGVSPDGSHLMGAVLTFPRKPATGDPCAGAATWASGSFGLDVYTAASGQPASLLYHQDFAVSTALLFPRVLELQGWNNIGPFGVFPATLATQGGGPMHYPGVAVTIDATTGKVANQVSDPNSCFVWDIALSGDFACQPSNGAVSVRKPGGGEIWHASNTGIGAYYLSPDEERVLALSDVAHVVGRNGSNINLPANFFYSGWLDASTVIGGGFGTNFQYVALGSPSKAVNIGFTGDFVGTVQT